MIRKLNQLSLGSWKEHQKNIVVIILLIFLCLIMLQLSTLFQKNEKEKKIAHSIDITKQQYTIKATSILFKFPLFGDYVPTNLNNENIKQSMLDVKVVGIMYSEQEEHSQVLLKTADKAEKIYSVGDTLPGGPVIKRILQDGVVVLHNGTLERLSLPKKKLRFDKPAKPLVKE